ncbi:MAG TPA: inositol monophosphatase family protein [Vicinamibacteria bacterium]|nr:inositol monophosphatase family protein [Vicinamibacteria bacterium]
MDLSRALEEAMSAAVAAGAILREDFHRPGGARGAVDKAEADTEAEKLIRARLLAAFPDWRYVGEETGRAGGDGGAPVWLVDPNDGTRDYLAGRRGSAVSIGLLVEGRPALGVVFAFAYPDDEGDFFAWAEGCGPLRRNGRAVGAALPAALGALDVVLVSSGGDRDPETNLRCAAPARYRCVPSIAHRLALVAAGEAAAATSLFAPCAWDYAAGQALLRAAGGVLVDEMGSEVAYDASGMSHAARAFAAHAALARELSARPWESALRHGGASVERPVRLERGRAVADGALLSRAQGALMGQVAGDSLGSLVEFESADAIRAAWPAGPRMLADGGTWHTLAGQPTDDSEMALALARAIVAEGGYRSEAAFAAYREWYRSGPFDVGNTTRAALNGYRMGESQANGSLMRASPLGVLAHAGGPARAAAWGREDSALTHPHPTCGDAVAAFVVAVADAVRHGDGRHAWNAARQWARSASAAAPVVEALDAAESAPRQADGPNQGWVLIALQNAFHDLLHARSLEEGVVASVARGGDTDTNAAIAGALLGAVHGRAAVPPQWRSMILSCRSHPLRARHPRPMAFWPVDLYELAERLLLAGES